jgi:hypothetical protein
VSTTWLELIPDEQWSVYQRVISAVRARGLRFALGGAFALATYTGRWRNTKDLDLFILPRDRDVMVDVVTQTGLCDYYDQLPYDRGWIYRACEGETIVDLIWTTANRNAEVDEAWLSRGPELDVRGKPVRIIPAEELIWAKLYILHRDRCDWPDVLNLIYAAGPTLDWEHLLRRTAEDVRLLSGALSVFAWLSPGRAMMLPAWLWDRLHLPAPQPEPGPDVERSRADLLDIRPWYLPTLEDGQSYPS